MANDDRKLESLEVHQAHVPGLDAVSSDILLPNTDIELTLVRDRREARLKTPLDAIQRNCDHVTIACPLLFPG